MRKLGISFKYGARHDLRSNVIAVNQAAIEVFPQMCIDKGFSRWATEHPVLSYRESIFFLGYN